MNDRDGFEADAVVALYIETIPAVTTAYRQDLRRRLMDAPAPRRVLPPIRRRWLAPVLSGVVAVCVALSLLVLPLRPHSVAPASAATILNRLVHAQSSLSPGSGSAMITFTNSPNGDLPPAGVKDLGRRQIITRWTVLDSTHYRVDIRTITPTIDAGDQKIVVNGSQATTYNDVTGQAFRGRLDPRLATFVFGVLQSGRPLPLAQTVQEMVTALKQSQPGTYARVVEQGRVLGRTADIVEFGPATREGGSTCAGGAPPGRCTQFMHGYGQARLWIDHQHPILLKYEQSGVPVRLSGFDFGYRVLSISFGRPRSMQRLLYRPPVRPYHGRPDFLVFGGVATSGFGYGGRGMRWQPAPGFITAPPPVASNGLPFTLVGTGSQQSPNRQVIGVEGLYVRDVPPFPRTPSAVNPQANQVPVRGPWIYVQERLRPHGLPAILHAGTPRPTGRCTTWTGRYAETGDGWLAFQRGRVSVLLSERGLSRSALVRYAAGALCR